MQELERKEIEMELEDRRRMEIKKNLINDAAKKQDEPVDDSKLVEAMFDFLPDSSSEAPTPARETSVFNVSRDDVTLKMIYEWWLQKITITLEKSVQLNGDQVKAHNLGTMSETHLKLNQNDGELKNWLNRKIQISIQSILQFSITLTES